MEVAWIDTRVRTDFSSQLLAVMVTRIFPSFAFVHIQNKRLHSAAFNNSTPEHEFTFRKA